VIEGVDREAPGQEIMFGAGDELAAALKPLMPDEIGAELAEQTGSRSRAGSGSGPVRRSSARLESALEGFED